MANLNFLRINIYDVVQKDYEIVFHEQYNYKDIPVTNFLVPQKVGLYIKI